MSSRLTGADAAPGHIRNSLRMTPSGHDPGQLKVREATAEDAAVLGRINVDSWRHAFRGIVPADFLQAMSVEHQTERFLRFLDPGIGAEGYLAGLAGEVVGYTSLGSRRDPDAGPTTEELYAIYAVPKVWRTGVGRLLHGHALTRFQARRATHATLWVFEQNTPARAFYESLRMGTHRLQTRT